MSVFSDLMDLVYDATCQMLGLPSDTQQLRPLDYKDSPAGLQTPDDNLIFYLVQFGDEPINRQIDVVTTPAQGSDSMTKEVKHVRSLTIIWQAYGDDGFEWADKIRMKLFDPDIQYLFEQQGISLIPDIPEPVYVPEAIGTQWYKRYDLSAQFNQLIVDTSTIDTVASADVVIETEKGVVSECST